MLGDQSMMAPQKVINPQAAGGNHDEIAGETIYSDNRRASNKMKTIKFKVEECDSYFVATGVDHAIVTQAKTWPRLLYNIDEATRLHLQMKSRDKYHLELDLEPAVVSLVKKSGQI